MNVFAAKQLSYSSSEDGAATLKIGIKGPDGIYRVQEFEYEDIFADTDVARENKLAVVHAIASQMHWNIDKDLVNTNINLGDTSLVGIPAFIKQCIEQFIEPFETNEEFLNQTVSVFGNKQLTFKVSDFYEIDEDGDVVGKDVNLAAWLLKNNKLVSDLSEKPFEKPFVFANGVEEQGGDLAKQTDETVEQAKQVSKSNKQVKATNKTTFGFDIADEQRYATLTSQWGEDGQKLAKAKGFQLLKTDEERDEFFAKMNEKHGPKTHGGMVERVIFKMPDEYISQAAAIELAKTEISKLLEEYNKLHPEYNFDINKISIKSNTEAMIKGLWGGKRGVLTVDLYKDGTGKAQV